MARTKEKTKPKLRKVKFSFEAAEAREVFLSGDFNNWDTRAHPMKNDGNGKWNRTMMIPSGKYEYKFLADGKWLVDPCNDQSCPNCFGSENSVIDLELK
ncbi:MAG: isoamylase early set domain-containing protein [Thermodesulfobacteriota bacterium]